MFSAFLVTRGKMDFIIVFLVMVEKRKIYWVRDQGTELVRAGKKRGNSHLFRMYLKVTGSLSIFKFGFPQMSLFTDDLLVRLVS